MYIKPFCITLQAARGVRSLFNGATVLDARIFSIMGIAIVANIAVTATVAGDLRVAHFIGMRDLRGLPIIAAWTQRLSVIGIAAGAWSVLAVSVLLRYPSSLTTELRTGTSGCVVMEPSSSAW